MDINAVRRLLREDRRDNWSGRERLPLVTRTARDERWQAVLYSDLTEGTADAEIEAQIAHFSALNLEFEWKLFADDLPSDLRDRLAKRGFEIGDVEAMVVYDLEGGLEPLAGQSDCFVTRISDRQQLEDFKATAGEVFGKYYGPTTEELAKAINEGSTNHLAYVGYVDGEPATVGRLYTDPGSLFGGLYGGGTLERFRSRGCYRAMIHARAQDAIKLGAKFLQVDAMPTSLPILLRLGFVHVNDTWPCTLPNATRSS